MKLYSSKLSLYVLLVLLACLGIGGSYGWYFSFNPNCGRRYVRESTQEIQGALVLWELTSDLLETAPSTPELSNHVHSELTKTRNLLDKQEVPPCLMAGKTHLVNAMTYGVNSITLFRKGTPESSLDDMYDLQTEAFETALNEIERILECSPSCSVELEVPPIIDLEDHGFFPMPG